MAKTRMHVRSSTLPSIPLDSNRSARSSQATTLNDSEALAAQLEGKTLTPPLETTAVFTRAHNKNKTAATGTTASSRNLSGLEVGELNEFSRTLSRLRDARLDRQRYVMSAGKNDEVSKLAFTAKVERALARRMVGQDAVFSRPTASRAKDSGIDSEKRALNIAAN